MKKSHYVEEEEKKGEISENAFEENKDAGVS